MFLLFKLILMNKISYKELKQLVKTLSLKKDKTLFNKFNRIRILSIGANDKEIIFYL